MFYTHVLKVTKMETNIRHLLCFIWEKNNNKKMKILKLDLRRRFVISLSLAGHVTSMDNGDGSGDETTSVRSASPRKLSISDGRPNGPSRRRLEPHVYRSRRRPTVHSGLRRRPNRPAG